MADFNIRAQASSYWLGGLVIALYIVFVLLVTFGFGSYIYRTSWQAEAIVVSSAEGKTVTGADIDNMMHILRRERGLQRLKEETALQIGNLERDLALRDAEVRQSFAAIARAKENLALEADFAVTDLEVFQYELPGDARTKYENVLTLPGIQPERKVSTLLALVSDGFETADLDAATLARFSDLKSATETKFEKLVQDVTTSNAASHKIQSEKQLVADQIAAHNAQIAEYDAAIQQLRVTLPEGSIARARLSALSLNLPFSADILMRLVSFPTIFLTLIVTIAAGGLGTVVAFSRRYYSTTGQSSLTPARLFVNVGEGIAAAIAIFLFSGAGMLALTQGGGPANDVELSPYTVAFVAFLSGFMAEHAFASIQAAGKRIFNQNGEAEENGVAPTAPAASQAPAIEAPKPSDGGAPAQG